MDWNKTKSIFIIVFAILNIFLYLLYVERYNESKNVVFLVESSNEEKLEADKISYSDLPEEVESKPYVTGKMKSFVAADVPGSDSTGDVLNDKSLAVRFNEPMPLGEKVSTEVLQEFVDKTVYKGDNYVLWRIDEKNRQAVFFQEISGQPLYYSDGGKLTVYWNDNAEVVNYEQTIFENVEESEQQKTLIPAIQAIHTLYQKRLLPTNTEIDSAELGYSEYVTVSEETQMFLPTWLIKATLEDGTQQEFFVNAVKDGVIELKEKEEEEPAQ